MMREAYFHEDDEGQVQLLPLDNLQYCLEQMGEQQAFADAHQSGAGWTEMYVREAAPSKLSALGITGEQLRLAVMAVLPPYDAVFTGYGSYRVECRNVLAFGADNTETLFAGVDEQGVVEALWCSDGMPELLRLPLREQLLLADWNADLACLLSDTERFARYLQDGQGIIDQ